MNTAVQDLPRLRRVRRGDLGQVLRGYTPAPGDGRFVSGAYATADDSFRIIRFRDTGNWVIMESTGLSLMGDRPPTLADKFPDLLNHNFRTRREALKTLAVALGLEQDGKR